MSRSSPRSSRVASVARARRHAGVLVLACALGTNPSPASQDAGLSRDVSAPPPQPFVETLPGTLVRMEFVPVSVPAQDGPRVLWFARTETTWDAFDVFVFGLDEAAPTDGATDAIARPSKPFVLADRGYGHAGYPAISVSHGAARAFAAWLAAHTGRPYRLPTEAEWDAACALDAPRDGDPSALDAHAWTARNAERKTHPVASLAAGRAGLHDLLGNVAEWCDVPSGPAVLKGGSFQDRGPVGCASRRVDDPSLNQSDPQLPKSRWWLADGPFAGFRLVCDAPPPNLDKDTGRDASPTRDAGAAPDAPDADASPARGTQGAPPAHGVVSEGW